jgi:hypothetical protein
MNHTEGNSGQQIAITGDSLVEWFVMLPSVAEELPIQASYIWEARTPVQIRSQVGGAALLERGLVSALDWSGNATSVFGLTLPEGAIVDPRNDLLTRAYTIWRPFPRQIGTRELVWRRHRFLGMSTPVSADSDSIAVQEVPDCLVIDDSNLGFRTDQNAWPTWLSERKTGVRHILLKLSNPLCDGPLWELLINDYRDVLTIHCSADDLRKEYASIGQSLSWERSAIEVVRAARLRSDLSRAQRLVVTLGFSGAVVIERDGPAILVYDPRNQEGDWERKHPGLAAGLAASVTVGLAVQISGNMLAPDWVAGTKNGLVAGRIMHDGRDLDDTGEEGPGNRLPKVGNVLAGEIPDGIYRSVKISTEGNWQISSVVSTDDFRTIATRIVVEGDEVACRDIPAERIGAWTSIDRMEIESMRSARAIAREYLQQTNPSRPLSLAVFGPPGSGKSFVIKQMTKEPGALPREVKVLEFNISQFKSPEELPHAFQAIRDITVARAFPLVFWDEFDSVLDGAELGWVSRFLAPMQDGLFIEDGISRPIGPAIFIFAGGTHPSMESFKSRAMQLPGAKATDFLSRLRGYLDVFGPNPMSKDDQSFVLRRALLLRGLLSIKASGIRHGERIDIDPGVLNAFLDVSTYVHGARSMESIIDMSSISGKRRYERSSLPPVNQLGLHVDPDEFLSLVHQQSQAGAAGGN